VKNEFAILMLSEHRCWRKFVPFWLRLSSPFGPIVLLNGSSFPWLMPTLQLMSWPKRNEVSLGSLFSIVCVMPLNSSCSLESIGW